VDEPGGEQGGAGANGAVQLWPGAVVPYEVAPEVAEESIIQQAIAHLESKTRIRFQARDAQPDYVRFVLGTGFSSEVGRVGGEQEIVVVSGGEMGQLLHEIGHTLGRWHEHCRSDRDSYVEIKWQNVQPEARPNFLTQDFGPEQGPYDYQSIMHYPRVAFSINGERTLETTQTVPAGLPVGQRQQLSDGDCRVFEFLYKDVQAYSPTVFRSAVVPTAEAVTGYLRLPADYPAGLGARVEIGIRDTSRTGWAAHLLGQATLTDVQLVGGGRVPFQVPVSDVDPAARYTLEAVVDVAGAGSVAVGDLVTAKAYAVLTQGAPADVAVALTRVV
jgi:hypothetical protein